MTATSRVTGGCWYKEVTVVELNKRSVCTQEDAHLEPVSKSTVREIRIDIRQGCNANPPVKDWAGVPTEMAPYQSSLLSSVKESPAPSRLRDPCKAAGCTDPVFRSKWSNPRRILLKKHECMRYDGTWHIRLDRCKMRVKCVEIDALVSVHQPRAFGDWDGRADSLPNGLRCCGNGSS